MPYLVILAESPPSTGDAAKDADRYQKDHVLMAVDDDWVFGEKEKNNPRFRIVQVDGVVDDYKDLVKPGTGINRRVNTVSVDALDSDTKVSKTNDEKAGEVLVLSKGDFIKHIEVAVAVDVTGQIEELL